ncbi:hypothetical protein LZ32DRAFT_601073 [Colletotrichum eremochloae]|nr:hypothetical protein LZ32DRAFT_601073 [Colletotrichum eremochloae]
MVTIRVVVLMLGGVCPAAVISVDISEQHWRAQGLSVGAAGNIRRASGLLLAAASTMSHMSIKIGDKTFVQM